MRKEMNSKSKRKWVAGGLAAFASVALLTTGFATWIIGTQNMSTNIDGTVVNVDTAKNASIELVMKIEDANKKLVFAETSDLGGADIHWQEDELVGDLTLEFSEIYVLYGKDSGFDPAAKKLHFKISSIMKEGVDKKDTANSVSLNTFGRTGGPFTYFDIPADIDLDGGASAISQLTSTTNKYTFPSLEVSFTWGSAFGRVSPAEFYQNYFTTNADTLDPDERAVLQETVVQELKDMKTALHGAVINLTAELVNR